MVKIESKILYINFILGIMTFQDFTKEYQIIFHHLCHRLKKRKCGNI
jgi:hypothetical protein